MNDTVTPDELERLRSGSTPPILIDVRRQADREADPAAIPGALWKDPEKAGEWAKELGGHEVVIYCVRGGSVSRSVQVKLRERDVSVRFIEGGLDAWKRRGMTVTSW